MTGVGAELQLKSPDPDATRWTYARGRRAAGRAVTVPRILVLRYEASPTWSTMLFSWVIVAITASPPSRPTPLDLPE